MKGFVCHRCRRPVKIPHEQIEVRTEYRRISDYGRYAVIKTSELCVECADAAIDTARRAGAPKFEQLGLPI